MITNLYMIRHAHSPYIKGQERTRGLSEAGHVAAQKVFDLLEGENFAVIVSSPYLRAVQTVQELADRNKLPVIPYESLRERLISGEDGGASWEHVVSAIERSFVDHDYALPGGETTRQVVERAIPTIMELLQTYEGRSLAVGTHGNTMTIIMQYFDAQYGFAFWKSTSMPDIYKLRFEGQQLLDVERMWVEHTH